MDDHAALAENPYLRDPWSFGWLLEVPENSTLMARPFLSWTFGVNALLLGHGAPSYHVVNLLIHLANAALVAALVRRGLAFTRIDESLRDAVSLVAGLVWGVHPMNVQAVGYLIQRGESLATFFELLTLFAWLESGGARGRPGWNATACACPLLAVTTKEHGWIAPLLPLLWAWVFLGRTPAQEIRARPAFYALGASSWLLLAALTLTRGPLAQVGARSGIDAWSYLITQPEVLTHYVRLFLVPIGQSFDYDWPVATLASGWPWILLWLALFLATAWAVWRRWPAGFPAALIFVSLATTSSVLALPDLAFEHRFYLAGACSAALITAPLAQLTRRAPLALYAGALGVALVFGALTYQRCALFQSELSVWLEAIERNPAQRRALFNVGGLLLRQGDPVGALEYFRRVEAAGVSKPMQARLELQMGRAELALGHYPEARAHLLAALESYRGNRGRIHMYLGQTYAREGQLALARGSFEQALTTLEGRADLWFDLALVCAKLEDAAAAVRAYDRGLRLGGHPQPVLKELMAAQR